MNIASAAYRSSSATHLGWILGPVAGGLLYGYTSIGLLFLATAPIYVLAGLPFVGRSGRDTVRPVQASPASAPATWADMHLALHLTAALLAFSLAGQLNLVLVLHGTEQLHISKSQFGAMWTMSAMLVVLAQVPVATFMRRGGPYQALKIGSLLSGVAYAIVGFADSYAQLALCVLLIASADLLTAPAHQEAVALGAANEHARPRVGLVSLTLTLGRALGPLLGGVAYELCREQPRLLWALMGALWVVVAGLYAGASRRVAVQTKLRRDDRSPPG